MQQHYGSVKGNSQAGAVTFFGFLSFFPLLALAFFVIGWIAKVYPDAQQQLVDAITSIFPGMIGSGRARSRSRTSRAPPAPPGSSVSSACSTPASAGCPGCASRSWWSSTSPPTSSPASSRGSCVT
ncbi:YhjD/YihY/BrkB family envelope integrity protein [Nocardioides zeae]